MKLKITRKNKMSDASGTSSSGIGAGSLLAIVFITLKLTGFITWPWLWVLAPVWIPVLVVLGILLVCMIVYLITELI